MQIVGREELRVWIGEVVVMKFMHALHALLEALESNLLQLA